MIEFDLLNQQLEMINKETGRRLKSLEESDKKASEILATVQIAIELIKQSSVQTNGTINHLENTIKESIAVTNQRINVIEEKLYKRIQTVDEKVKNLENEPLEAYKKYKMTAITIVITFVITAILTYVVGNI